MHRTSVDDGMMDDRLVEIMTKKDMKLGHPPRNHGLIQGLAVELAVVGLLLTFREVQPSYPPSESVGEEERTPFETSQLTEQFAVSNGFSHRLTYSPATGLTQLQRAPSHCRPPRVWALPNATEVRSLLPAVEVYLIGGRVDIKPKPVMKPTPKPWKCSMWLTNMDTCRQPTPKAQHYHKCAVVDIIYAIGDHHRFLRQPLTGWSRCSTHRRKRNGTNMPNQSGKLAGVASQDGMIYVAGGDNERPPDSTNRLLRYDEANDMDADGHYEQPSAFL